MNDWTSKDEEVRILFGDCRERMRELPDNSVDSVVCDPPYLLSFMGREWDSVGGKKGMRDETRARQRSEYADSAPGAPRYAASAVPAALKPGEATAMQAWHHSWAVEAYRVLKPGGHLLAFGGTRTVHRLACALEDAGFEIRDSILEMLASDQAFRDLWDTLAPEQQEAMGKALESVGLTGLLSWNHSQGFPKGLNVSKKIDRILGAEREVVATREEHNICRPEGGGDERFNTSSGARETRTVETTAPATPEAKKWDGFNVAMKPSFEPVVCCRKPLSESNVASNVLKWGTGALNIGACRVGTEIVPQQIGGMERFNQKAHEHGYRPNAYQKDNGRNGEASAESRYDEKGSTNFAAMPGPRNGSPQGRWPANTVLLHHPECVCRGVKKVKGGTGGKASGDNAFGHDSGWNKHNNRSTKIVRQNDENGQEQVEDWDCHPECPAFLLNKQSGKSKSSGGQASLGAFRGGKIYGEGKDVREQRDPGYGDSGGASRFLYQAKASRRDRWFYCRDCQAAFCETERQDHQHGHDKGKPDWKHIVAHPTVKPLSLMRYLARLVTPPGGVVLDPFLGTGTTAVACIEEGFRCIGCEQDPEYAVIARTRVEAKAAEEQDRFPLFREQPHA